MAEETHGTRRQACQHHSLLAGFPRARPQSKEGMAYRGGQGAFVVPTLGCPEAAMEAGRVKTRRVAVAVVWAMSRELRGPDIRY